MNKARKQNVSLPQKIARTAVWMLIVPAAFIAQAIRSKTNPRGK